MEIKEIPIAPWTDYKGKEIKEGDIILHPNGDIGRTIYLHEDQWKVDYGDGILSRLNLQIGDKGQALVVPKYAEVFIGTRPRHFDDENKYYQALKSLYATEIGSRA